MKINIAIVPVLLTIVLSACGQKQTENFDTVYGAVYDALNVALTAEGGTAATDGTLPMYILDRARKGDEGFETYLESYGISAAGVEEYAHFFPMMNVKSDNIWLLLSSDEAKTKEGLTVFHEGQVSVWESYLPEQYEKVKRNITDAKDGFVYYVTHDAQTEIVTAIENALKK